MKTIRVGKWRQFLLLLGSVGTIMAMSSATAGKGKVESTRAFPYKLAFQMRKFRYYDQYALSPDASRVAIVAVAPSDTLSPKVRFLENGTPIDALGARIEVSAVSEQAAPNHAAICGGQGNQWSPVWSPDSRRLAFYSDADGKARIWLMDVGSGVCRRVSDVLIRTSMFFGYQAHWSPDGSKLFVPVRPEPAWDVSDSEQLDNVDQDTQHDTSKPPVVFYSGAEQPPIVKASASKHVDASSILLAHYNSTLVSIDVDTGKTRTVVDAHSKPYPATLELSPSGNWMTYTSVARGKDETATSNVKDLSVVPAAGGTSQLLAADLTKSESPINYTELDYRWHPTRDSLVYLKDGAAWLVDFTLAGPSAPRRLAPELGVLGNVVLYFSRDGKSVLVGLDANQEGHSIVPKRLGVIPLDGSKPSTYALPEPSRWQFVDVIRANDDVLWQPRAGEVSFLARDRESAEETVFRMDLSTGKTRAMNTGLHQLSHFAAGRDHQQLLAIFEDIATPPDLYRYSADLAAKSRVSVVEPRAEGLVTGTPKVLQVRVPSNDGSLKTVRTTLLLPPGAQRGDKLPTIVMIYTGWDLSTGATYYGGGMGNTVPNQIFTSRGYAVMMANVALSPGGEPNHPQQNFADVLLPQVYAAAHEGYIDIDRLAISGQSNGGYSTATVVRETNLFRAAIPVNGFYDLAPFWNGMDKYGINWTEKGQGPMGASSWTNLQSYIDNSPFYGIDKIHTPLLIVSGEADEQCPPDNARRFFVGLRRLERPAQLLVYPGEGHVISEWSADHSVDVSRKMIDFLNKHLDKPDL